VKVILDTNIIVPGVIRVGTPSAIIRAWYDGVIQLVWSSEIMDEYVRVARRMVSLCLLRAIPEQSYGIGIVCFSDF
jgi:predicted nucleic acid-binding protein